MTLKIYSIKERPVLSIDFSENHKIYSTSAPSSGAAILNALNSIKQFDDNVWSNSNYTAQVLAESFKVRYTNYITLIFNTYVFSLVMLLE